MTGTINTPKADKLLPICDLIGGILGGRLESQAEQTCQHARLSGSPMSGFCLDCGDDIMVAQVENHLRENPSRNTRAGASK